MKIGNTSFTPAAFVGVSREEFIKRYRGKLDGADINEAYDKIQNENGIQVVTLTDTGTFPNLFKKNKKTPIK